MIKAGIIKFISNYLAFAKNFDISKIAIVIIYINHFLFFKPNLIEINIIKFFLANKYNIKDLSS